MTRTFILPFLIGVLLAGFAYADPQEAIDIGENIAVDEAELLEDAMRMADELQLDQAAKKTGTKAAQTAVLRAAGFGVAMVSPSPWGKALGIGMMAISFTIGDSKSAGEGSDGASGSDASSRD